MELGELKQAITEGMKPLSDSVKGVEDKLSAVEKRVETIEKTPLGKGGIMINTIPTEYRGKKLHKQFTEMRELAGKSPERFGAFSDPQKVDEFCKGVLDVIAKTTLNETTAAQGAYLVPDEFQWDIIELARSTSFALQRCKVIPMASDNLYLPAELTLPTVYWADESGGFTQSDPTFAQVQLTAKKLYGYSHATNEMLADAAVDVVGMLTRQMIYGITLELDNQVLNGTGSPTSGVLGTKAGYSVVISGTSISAITGTDLSTAIQNLSEGYLAGSIFVVGRLLRHYIRTLKDSNNNFIYQSIAGGTNNTVWDYPIITSEKVSSTDGDATAFGVFGNFNYFYIGRRQGAMAIEADPYGRFDYDQTRFRMVTRWGLTCAVANAFCRIMT